MIEQLQRRKKLNKDEVVSAIADEMSCSKTHARRHLDAFIDVVGTLMEEGHTVGISGFGKFYTTESPPRELKNPRTGKRSWTSGGAVARFVAGSQLKRRLKPEKDRERREI